jgi:hypothetical protein
MKIQYRNKWEKQKRSVIVDNMAEFNSKFPYARNVIEVSESSWYNSDFIKPFLNFTLSFSMYAMPDPSEFNASASFRICNVG